MAPIIKKKEDFAYFCQKLQTKPQLVIFKEHFDMLGERWFVRDGLWRGGGMNTHKHSTPEWIACVEGEEEEMLEVMRQML